MPKQQSLIVNGDVSEALGNSMFRVTLDNGAIVLAHLSGRIRMNNIRILPGDKVIMEMSPYDLTKARITIRTSSQSKPKS